MKTPTITDVARVAGVSIKTVSRVLNEEPNVRLETKNKVHQAVEELGYRPNLSARGLAGGRSFRLAFLYDTISPGYLMKLQEGIMQTCSLHHYFLGIKPVDSNQCDLIEEIRSWLSYSKVEGLILTPPLTNNEGILRLLAQEKIPYVIISAKDETAMGAIFIEETDAARDMTKHLISLGHKDIGFVKGHKDHQSNILRYNGYLQAMSEAGLPVRDEWVYQGDYHFESGYKAGLEFLQQPITPSAIFASNDDMAAGVMRAAMEKGLQLPKDLAVAGFDDTPTSSQVWPALTTVRQPVRQMGEVGANVLISLIKNQPIDETMTKAMRPAYSLKIRESTIGHTSR